MNCVFFLQTRVNLLVPQNRPCTISAQTSRSSHWTPKVGDNCSWWQGASVLSTSLVRGWNCHAILEVVWGALSFLAARRKIVKPYRNFLISVMLADIWWLTICLHSVLGALQRIFFPKIRDYNGSGWVGPGLTLNFFGKSSQNSPKPVLIFWNRIPCVFCLYNVIAKSYWLLWFECLSMSVMGFQTKKFGWG